MDSCFRSQTLRRSIASFRRRHSFHSFQGIPRTEFFSGKRAPALHTKKPIQIVPISRMGPMKKSALLKMAPFATGLWTQGLGADVSELKHDPRFDGSLPPRWTQGLGIDVSTLKNNPPDSMIFDGSLPPRCFKHVKQQPPRFCKASPPITVAKGSGCGSEALSNLQNSWPSLGLSF